MPPTAIALVLLAGLLHAGWNIVARKAGGGRHFVLLISPILVDYLGNVMRIPLLLPGALADRAGFMRDLRTQWTAALVLAVFSPLAYVMVLYAVQLAPLSHVAPAREVSMLFAALLGGHLPARLTVGLGCLARPAWPPVWCCWLGDA